MLTNAQECACRAIDKKGRDKALVILVSDADLAPVRRVVAVSFGEGTPSDGTTWYPEKDEPVSVYRYSDPVLRPPFRLEICTNGANLSEADKIALIKWQKASEGD